MTSIASISVKGIAKPVQTYQVIGFHGQLEKGDIELPIAAFVEDAVSIRPETLVRDINIGRRLNDGFEAIVVIENNSPVGLLMSYNLNRILNSHSHRANFFEQPVATIMDGSPLIVEKHLPMKDVVRQAMARESNRIYDPVIVTEKGELAGIAPVHILVEKLIGK